MKAAIYIDDTGSPGQETNSRYLQSNRKTWAAVIFNADERESLRKVMEECIGVVKKEFEITEFHFTELLNGKKQYRKINMEDRLLIFKLFATLFREWKLPIIIQTINNDSFLEAGMILPKMKICNFKIDDNGDMALILALAKCKEFIDDNRDYYGYDFDIIVDEGKQKKDTCQQVELLRDIMVDDKIQYKASNEDVLLQLADYVAFCINRTQILATKEDRTEWDKKLLEIFNYADFNILNLERYAIDGPKEYDRLMRMDKDKKGLLSDEVVDMVRPLYDELKRG